jgi:hypothetical protein
MFSTAELTATQGEDGVGMVDPPAHSRLLQAESHDGLAASFDHFGANK